MIESTGERLTELERIETGIKHCRAEIKRLLGTLHLLQSQRNQEVGIEFVQRDYLGEPRWFVMKNGKQVCRDYGYPALCTAMGAATRLGAKREKPNGQC
jgi:hypothetical protein